MCMLAPDFMQEQAAWTEPARRVPLAYNGADIVCGIPVIPGVSAGISLASAGDMGLTRDGVLPSRSSIRERLGISRGQLFGARQIHSQRVIVCDGQSSAEVAGAEADGLIAGSVDAVLSVTVADCLPIFLADRRTGAFGIVHSGWKGTGIVGEAVRMLSGRFGSRPEEITVVVGPGIGACCYTVPAERAARFVQRFGPAVVVPDPRGPHLDLREANLVLLREAGVRDVTVVSSCTSCTPALGSYRRQGPGTFTLMLAWIGRVEAVRGV